MGAWGTGNFENDGALDWLGDLTRQDALAPIRATLRDRGDSASHGEAILAAAEVVAALNGHPMGDPPEALELWVLDKPALGSAVTVKALEAVEWVRNESELAVLFDYSEPWLAVVDELAERLERPPRSRSSSGYEEPPRSLFRWFKRRRRS